MEETTRNKLKIGIGAAAVVLTIGALAGFTLKDGNAVTFGQPVYATKAYQCGGFINYGGVDEKDYHETHNGTDTSIVFTVTDNNAAIASGQPSTHNGYKWSDVTRAYWRGTTNSGNVLKLGNSSAGGTITYTLDQQYTRFVVWASGYNATKASKLQIGNGEPISMTKETNASGVVFNKYIIDDVTMDKDCKITIQSTKDKDARVYIASIAFYN